jgi:methylmalonyl-CoA mutase cobalamin-binding subunit
MIEEFRTQSKNRALLVVVGGGLVKQRPDLANALAVDAVFTAAQGAPEVLLARLPAAAEQP